eukprot:TRINITY_DN113278_c0_g1_i1.p1 TRINITY_DN113278_c0_g1~~TRINITY_DN113278_c0_g1_i1.p1  ORF type:complete len:376 (+),score=39.94 TRINITY_DN113278_c0_g1_i1:89-1216(+)
MPHAPYQLHRDDRCGPHVAWDIAGLILTTLLAIAAKKLLLREYICSRKSEKDGASGYTASRSSVLDQIRGAAAGFALMFHIMRDMKMEGLVPPRQGHMFAQNKAAFLVYVVAVVTLWFVVAEKCPAVAGIVYIVGSWICITYWKKYSIFIGVGCFLTCVGMSSAMSHEPRATKLSEETSGSEDKADGGSLAVLVRLALRRTVVLAPWTRLAKLGGAALAVTLVTRLASAKRWIGFGVLHMIFVVSVAHLPFLEAPSLLVAFVAASCHLLVWLDVEPEPERLLGRPWASWDYQPVMPFLPFALWGIVLYRMGITRAQTAANPLSVLGIRLSAYTFRTEHLLAGMGRWSLSIYLLHRPLLMPVVKLASWVCHWWNAS